MAPPPKAETAPVGELRMKMEYASRACHMGQYDYGGEANYYPRQEEVDKGLWQNDPFYGWNIQGREEQPMLENKLGGRSALAERNSKELWSNDPFHGWLKHDKAGHVVDDGNLALKAAEVERQRKHLPHFDDIDKTRYEISLFSWPPHVAIPPAPSEFTGRDFDASFMGKCIMTTNL